MVLKANAGLSMSRNQFNKPECPGKLIFLLQKTSEGSVLLKEGIGRNFEPRRILGMPRRHFIYVPTNFSYVHM
jgi:hypothetical protein